MTFANAAIGEVKPLNGLLEIRKQTLVPPRCKASVHAADDSVRSRMSLGEGGDSFGEHPFPRQMVLRDKFDFQIVQRA